MDETTVYPEAPAPTADATPVADPAPTADASLSTSDSIEAGATITQAEAPAEQAAPEAEMVVSAPKAFEGGERVHLEEEVKLMINGVAHRIQSGISWVEAHVAEALRNIGKLKE